MALYEYRCSGCEERFELMRSMGTANDPALCPECGSESRRLISNFATITPGVSAIDARPGMSAGGSGGGCCGGGCGCG